MHLADHPFILRTSSKHFPRKNLQTFYHQVHESTPESHFRSRIFLASKSINHTSRASRCLATIPIFLFALSKPLCLLFTIVMDVSSFAAVRLLGKVTMITALVSMVAPKALGSWACTLRSRRIRRIIVRSLPESGRILLGRMSLLMARTMRLEQVAALWQTRPSPCTRR